MIHQLFKARIWCLQPADAFLTARNVSNGMKCPFFLARNKMKFPFPLTSEADYSHLHLYLKAGNGKG